jgi:hypothetical protein
VTSESLLLGNGDGTFQAAQNYAAGDSPTSVVVRDFDGDGHLDLAVANGGYDYRGFPGNMSVLLGTGDGTFQAAQNYAAGAGPTSVVVGDFNGDSYPDLAVTAREGVTVLLNAADWGRGPVPPPRGRPGLAGHESSERHCQ